MLDRLSQRLLPVLQLTRMALVFTAISNSICTLILATEGTPRRIDLVLVSLISIGLYGFGMSLNDIIDRRRDRQLAAHRPLPSGRIGVYTAHIVCGTLLALALGAASIYARKSTAGWMSIALTVWTAVLILFYDFAGKYLVAPGLLTLGLIRFFHAVIPCPEIAVLWHPLLLFTHVAVLSAVAYAWEEKRPALTRGHLWAVAGGVAGVNALALLIWWNSHPGRHAVLMDRALVWPAAAVAVFVPLGYWILRRGRTFREAGQTLMLAGLLWLIVYDAAFVTGYVGWRHGLMQLALLPLSYLAVQFMRWWSRIVAVSQQPQFKRARGGVDAR